MNFPNGEGWITSIFKRSNFKPSLPFGGISIFLSISNQKKLKNLFPKNTFFGRKSEANHRNLLQAVKKPLCHHFILNSYHSSDHNQFSANLMIKPNTFLEQKRWTSQMMANKNKTFCLCVFIAPNYQYVSLLNKEGNK